MSVLLVPPTEPSTVTVEELPEVSPFSAFFYFITATFVSAAAYVAVAALRRRVEARIENPGDIIDTDDETHDPIVEDEAVSFWVLLSKLGYPAFSLFFTFAVTMIFPIYTQVSRKKDTRYVCRTNSITGYRFCPSNGKSVPLFPA